MRIFLLIIFVLSIRNGYSQNLISGGKLKPEQAIMDIRHYTINLDVDPATKSISGFTQIDLILSEAAPRLMFDLVHLMKVSKVWVNDKPKTFEQKDDFLFITGDAFAQGRQKIKIAYAGVPGIAERAPWEGGFQWEKDSNGKPWIAVSCQGEGAKIYFPCKDHPSDEPNEGADMIITVPKGLSVAGPGLLKSVKHSGKKSSFHWKTNYTINNYCLVFNVGDYKVVSRDYTSISGRKIPMQFYVLAQNEDKAAHHLTLLENSARILEKYFGEYPWANEKIGIAETPHLGMEHQTMNAYGNKFKYVKLGGQDFDWLLHHEFGHEWWANKVSNKDWAHMWIQEGICCFGDALAVREMEGEEAYLKKMQSFALGSSHKLPIVQGEEIDSDKTYHGDIYGKGAFFMHTLRYIMGDEKFFPTLKKLATDPQYTYDNMVVTKDVEKLFSGAHKGSLEPLFKLFLYTTEKLQVAVKQTKENDYFISLLNLDMEIPIEIVTDKGSEKLMINKKGRMVKSNGIIQVDPKGYYLKKVVYE